MSVYTILGTVIILLERATVCKILRVSVASIGKERDDLSESEGQGRGNASDHYLVVLTSELNISAYNWNFAFCFISYPPNFIQICKIFF